MKRVTVPDIGDFKDVPVIEVLVGVGDAVAKEQTIAVVESEKATLEIPSSDAGIVASVDVKVGDRVSAGSALLSLQPSEVKAADIASQLPTTASPSPGGSASSTKAAVRASEEPLIVVVPDIGDFKDVPVIEVLVTPGESVTADQALVMVESEKATMEIPSPAAGRIVAFAVKVGDRVSAGVPLATLERTGVAPVVQQVTVSAVAPAISKTEPREYVDNVVPLATFAAGRTEEAPAQRVHAGPAVRQLARKLGVNLHDVKGTGRRGRIVFDDVHGHVKSIMPRLRGSVEPAAAVAAPFALAPWPKVDFAKFGPIEAQPLARIRKISGANLHRNWVTIPHVTNHDDADVTELEAFRTELNRDREINGFKVSPLAFVVKACVAALKAFPNFNASLDGETLIVKRYFHIGFAADTPDGLVVPVIRDADQKGVIQIAKEMAELAAKARAGKLSAADMQGGCFSISSLGGIGGSYFTPIINAPEVAILGVGKTQTRVIWIDGQAQPRLYLPLSLSWDHRVVDGAAAGRFNAYLTKVLGDLRRLLL